VKDLEKNGETEEVRDSTSNNRSGEIIEYVVKRQIRPEAKLAMQLEAVLLALEKEFGLTPASAARIPAGVEGTSDKASRFFAPKLRTYTETQTPHTGPAN
jgi:phage terminase small subunit